jgi:ribosomal protein L44E
VRGIPKKDEYFCESCRKFHPRDAIATVKWTLNGKQARFYCKKCNDAIKARTMGETA